MWRMSVPAAVAMARCAVAAFRVCASYGPAVAVTISVRRLPVPIAKSGRKVFPALDSPSYSPTKYPFGPRANGSFSTSNDLFVSRNSLPQSLAWAHVTVAEGWQ